MRHSSATAALVIVLCMLGFNGCGKRPAAAPPAGESAAHDEHEHDHGHEGPHGGHIIELGVEDYHAELTHDADTNRVAIYILGPDAKTPVPIDAESVTINVRAEDKPEQFVLPAVPQPGETEGKTSYFELVSEPLHKVVAGEAESPKTTARLSLNIGGKPFSGMIETAPHDHDHDHDHAH